MTVETKSKKQVVDITDQVNSEVRDQTGGICQLFLLHTTAALTTADLDPGTDQDLLDVIEQIMPRLRYRHPHNPEHAPDHIAASLIGPSLTIPVKQGKLVLGTWQRVVLLEFDGPRHRQIEVNFG